MFIDSHTHLYLTEFDADRKEMMQRAKEVGITKFFLPAIDSSETARMLDLEREYPGVCFAMMGLHPCSVKENYEDEMQLVEEWLKKRKFSAVGEIGIDLYWDKTFIDQQHDCFHKQIEWALQYQLPIVIHTRNAMRETIDVVKQYQGKGLKGIFHCFGDTYEYAMEIIELGFLLGIGGVVTYKKSGLDQVLSRIDLNHLVLETDAPYLTPVPYRGKRNESAYIKIIAEKIAEIKNVSVEEVGEVTGRNAVSVFSVVC